MAGRKKHKSRMKPQYVRSKGRRNKSSVLARRTGSLVAVLGLLIGILLGLKASVDWVGRKLYSENPHFEIQHLVVQCDGTLSEDRIREYTGLAEGQNLFAVPFAEIEASLQSVAVVESVYIERKLPHTLIVKVKERIPVARIMGSKTRRFPFVVDRYGVILPPRQSADTLPLIKGFEDELRLGMPMNHPDMESALTIIALCESSGSLRNYVHIESLDVKYDDYIDMRLKGNIRVRMPRFKFKTKLHNLATVIKISSGQGRQVKEVDLTLDSDKVPVTYY